MLILTLTSIQTHTKQKKRKHVNLDACASNPAKRVLRGRSITGLWSWCEAETMLPAEQKSNYSSKIDGRWDALDSAWASGRGTKWTTALIKKELKAPPVSTYCAAASETALTGMFSHNGRLKQLSISEPRKPPTPPRPVLSLSLIVPVESRAIPQLAVPPRSARKDRSFFRRFHWRSRVRRFYLAVWSEAVCNWIGGRLHKSRDPLKPHLKKIGV